MEKLFEEYIKHNGFCFHGNKNSLVLEKFLKLNLNYTEKDFKNLKSWLDDLSNIKFMIEMYKLYGDEKEKKTIQIKRQVNPPIEVYSKPKNTMKYSKNSYALIFDK